MGSFVSWFERSYKGIIVVLVAIMAVMMVVLAMQHVAASKPAAGTVAGPVPTFTSTPSTRTVTVTRDGETPLNVLFAGDSLTGGLYSSTQADAFKWRMLDSMEASGPVKEYNSALSGGTTLQVSDKYPVPSGLDLAVIELGTNDQGNQVPMDEFDDAYSALLQKVTDGSPDVQIVCAGVWEANGGEPGESAYDTSIRRLCAKAGGLFVSLRPIYTENDVIGPVGEPTWQGETDDFHPNDKGHKLIADALLQRIVIQ
ncbi:SGNH/GDSL hydrolase family protein [Curtobacterium sp. MCLR17_036]|uniref:SGNH/GDSL hydrolase family protein n=1 Tax=Curtobacterium sp. MCLR17_036 TaxID=2175620 RepID=UPI000DA98043|nr:SGNH/GDSL hydrolase family protein [Curtobacterium sp. MCLR17_036]WIE65967.1 SGNH/GDSL hydrolase family protein [Curtobacterium sp. MCLR17_036]